MSKLAILLIFLLFLSLPTLADSSTPRAATPPHKRNTSAIDLLKNLALSHSIDGYEENCKQDTLIAWGKPKSINPNNPQLSQITLINIIKKKITRTVDITGGIFGARYLQDGKFIYLEGTPETLLNLASGAPLAIDERTYSTLRFEACNNSPRGSYLKYAK